MNLFEKYIHLKYSCVNINNPEFEKTGRIHDWRNYVPEEWKENWDEFTERER